MTLLEDQRQQAIHDIERARSEIIEGVLEEMYQNPFWDARYGERGRRLTRQDTNHHLNYLVSAVDLNNPPTLTSYFHWNQGLLPRHGMCTLHLRQTLDSLAHQLARWLPDAWPTIEPIFQASYQGLYYETAGCQALAQHQEAIARTAAARLAGLQPSAELSTFTPRQRASYQDYLYHLSYLADAVACDSPKIFTGYIAWLKTFFPTINLDPADLTEALRILALEIETDLGSTQAAPFLDLISQAETGED